MFVETPCAPVWDWTVFGQFHNWGYFLFGASRGLAWSWWTRFLLLPLFLYLFLLKWCDGDKLVAFAGSAAVTLGAPTQWWDTTVPYHLAYLFAVPVFLRLTLASRRIWTGVLSAFGLFVSLASFFFVMYPPFTMLLLPALAIVSVFEMKGAAAQTKRYNVFLASLAAVALAAELVYFISVHAEVLSTIRESSYPGSRFFRGGSFKFLCERTLADVMSFCSTFVHGHNNLNKCVISEYVGLSVPIAFGMAFFAWKRRLDGFAFSLLAYVVLLFAWCLFEWPTCLARWTGFYLVPPRRASVVGGFVMLVCALRWITFGKDRPPVPAWIAFAAAGVFFGFRCVALCVHGEIAAWFRESPVKISLLVSGLALSAFSAYGILMRRRVLFAVSLLLFSVATGAFVHPLSSGLSPVFDKQLSKTILEIDAARPGVWTANDRVVAQLPVALGLHAYSGTQQYCDVPYWNIVDPEKKRRSVWNRYGHRYVTDFEGKGVLENRKRMDAMFYSLDEEATRSLGIKYVIWRGAPVSIPWLRNIANVKNDHIYEVVEDSASGQGAACPDDIIR